MVLPKPFITKKGLHRFDVCIMIMTFVLNMFYNYTKDVIEDFKDLRNGRSQFSRTTSHFSINLHAVFDAKLYIRQITAPWPGSAHDSRILNNSRIKIRFEINEFENS